MVEPGGKDPKKVEREKESLDNDVIAGDDDLVGRDVSGTEPAWDGRSRADEGRKAPERSEEEEPHERGR